MFAQLLFQVEPTTKIDDVISKNEIDINAECNIKTVDSAKL